MAFFHLEAKQAESGHAGQTVGAAGEVLPGDDDQQQNLAYAQGGEGEVMRFQAQHRCGNQCGQHEGQRHGEQQRVFAAKAVARTEDGGDIGASAKKGALCQRQSAGVAENELITKRQQRVNADDGENAYLVGRFHLQRPQGEQQHPGNEQRPDAGFRPVEYRRCLVHTRRCTVSPNKPCGRKNMMASSAM